MKNIDDILPDSIRGLGRVAMNFWWSWDPDAQAVLRRIDPEGWDRAGGNPVAVLRNASADVLERAAGDSAFVDECRRVVGRFDAYLARETWFAKHYPDAGDARIAYFCMEYGLHECLPIYAGGLGILAGDHLKSASDLGLPLVGVGLLYREGYFVQLISKDGAQTHDYSPLDVGRVPLTMARNPDGTEATVTLQIGPREVAARIWRADVGRVSLLLLDTDLESNDAADRSITRHLYGGDDEVRIRQEVLLGIGGVRALAAVGIEPTVWHMNEGHAAFLGFEVIRRLMDRGRLTFDEARQAAAGGLAFTTHTPVPAGIDRFPARLLEKYLAPYRAELGISAREFASLGADSPNEAGLFSMAVLALKLAGAANGVSKLHARVSRKMWHVIWPGASAVDAPIQAITNGVHSRSWIGSTMSAVFDRYLGSDWDAQRPASGVWDRVAEIPDAELLAARSKQRAELVTFVRGRLAAQCRRRDGSPKAVAAAEQALDADMLTIGFARRFAAYKRGDLLFRNIDRLARICAAADRPVQFVFAGKAHPRDQGGQAIIQRIVKHMGDTRFARRVVFVENYDIAVGRALVCGCDVWLNNPIKPREASGTSGMKVPLNGGLNVSILDGWWPEAFNGTNGWAIPEAPAGTPDARRDDIESAAIYDLLENEIIPLFYDRDERGVPRRWLDRVRSSIRTVVPAFCTERMVEQYASQLYVPAIERARRLAAGDFTSARSLAKWKRNLRSAWAQVIVEGVEFPATPAGNGDAADVRARVRLGTLRPEDVLVEVISDSDGLGDDAAAIVLQCGASAEGGAHVFEGAISGPPDAACHYTVRVLPRHPDLAHAFDGGVAALQ